MDRVTTAVKEGSRERSTRLVPSLVFTFALLGLISLSIEASRGYLALVLVGSVGVLVTGFHYLFHASRFFAFAFANLTGVYACVFVFFVESNFVAVDPPVLWAGFLLPLAAFFGGALWRRRAIQEILRGERLRDERDLAGILGWLVPVFAIGALTYLVPANGGKSGIQDVAFLAAMAAIAAIVLSVSRDVAVFLLDTAILFEEFFQRAARLVAPAFAFMTFYSLLVIVFATGYSLIDSVSGQGHFRIEGVVRRITFPESLYFSLTTLSTVGYGDIAPAGNLMRVLVALEMVCGILLLLFGFNEIISHSRERGGASQSPVERIAAPDVSAERRRGPDVKAGPRQSRRR